MRIPCQMVKGDIRTKFVHLERYLKSRAESSLFLVQLIILRLICVILCAASSAWLYTDFIGGRYSPDVPQRDLMIGFNCLLPHEYQWTEFCDPNSVRTSCKGSVFSLRFFTF